MKAEGRGRRTRGGRWREGKRVDGSGERERERWARAASCFALLSKSNMSTSVHRPGQPSDPNTVLSDKPSSALYYVRYRIPIFLSCKSTTPPQALVQYVPKCASTNSNHHHLPPVSRAEVFWRTAPLPHRAAGLFLGRCFRYHRLRRSATASVAPMPVLDSRSTPVPAQKI
jgi:hypothetical protein